MYPIARQEGRKVVNQPGTGEIPNAKVEKVKGTIKEVAGEVLGNPKLVMEGHAQRMAAAEQLKSESEDAERPE
jgi:uncharacterized protein YjbJ (UPF0337 family)